MAAVLHIEGAEAIDAGLRSLEVLHAAGLRSLGPVWSRPNIFGHGVPFRFPSSPDTGPGLTAAGKDLVRFCNERQIAIDLSHLNERGFWDAAEISNAPLIATHSNAHALCASSRNLTDTQIAAIGKSGGMIGLNYANGFLREDGKWNADTPFETLLRHLDHMIAIAGEDSVGLGSDFEGARIPAVIGTVLGLPAFQEAMRAHGYGAAKIRKICFENWLRVLERTWGS
jgi:membrane dipeptidase